MNQVHYGVNTLDLNFSGQDIATVAGQCKAMFNLGNDEIVKVNNVEVNADYVVQNGDYIEFVKSAGEKGSDATVTVQCGVNSVQININDNSTVQDVVNRASSYLGIDARGQDVLLNGSVSQSTSQVYAGDRIEFRKNAGEKGV